MSLAFLTVQSVYSVVKNAVFPDQANRILGMIDMDECGFKDGAQGFLPPGRLLYPEGTAGIAIFTATRLDFPQNTRTANPLSVLTPFYIAFT